MKWLDKLVKKTTIKASDTMKDEVKRTVVNVLPKAIGLITAVAGIMIFKNNVAPSDLIGKTITNSRVTTVTNNYFFKDLSEEMVNLIIENGRKK